MSERTLTHPPQLQALKAATKALVKAAGGQEACEELTGKSHSRFAAYGLPNTGDFMPVQDVLALEAVTHGHVSHPHVTRFLARQAGFALVKLPSAPNGNSDWHKALGALSREVGEVVDRVCEVLSDDETPGSVTAFEIKDKQIVGEIDEAIEKLVAMRALAMRALEDGGGS